MLSILRRHGGRRAVPGMCSSEGIFNVTLYCLIMEPMPLVAHDLATTAREDLGFEPLVAATVDEARAHLSGLAQGSTVRLAFVHHAPADFARGQLRRELEAQGAQIVLIGPGMEGAIPEAGWPALAWPFTTEHVLAAIGRPRDPAGRPCNP